MNFYKDYNLADYWESCVRAYKNREALVFEDKRYTYEELNNEANKIANWALSENVKPGDIIALYMTNRPEFLISWLGLHKVGATVALINTEITGFALEHALNVANAKLLIMGSELLEKFNTLKNVNITNIWIFFGTSTVKIQQNLPEKFQILDQMLERASTDTPSRIHRKGVGMIQKAFLIYTSGTTGLPKAATVSHKRAIEIWIQASKFLRLEKDDRLFLTLPLYHTSGNLIGTAVWRDGGTVILDRKFSVSQWLPKIRKYKATCFLYIGEVVRYLLNQPERPDDKQHTLKKIFGNGLRADVWEKFVKRFGVENVYEIYSATESNVTMVNPLSKVGACGYVPPIAFYINPCRIIKFDIEKEEPIRDKNGFCIECDWDEPGQLIGKINQHPKATEGNFTGYTDKKATEKKILRDVFKKGDMWFASGDILKFSRDGFLYFIDRIGDTFRWKGQNVSTLEVATGIKFKILIL